MAFVSHRRLAIPLWAVAFFTVAVTVPPSATMFQVPPTTVFAIAGVGIAAIALLMSGAMTFLRTPRALVRVVPSGYRDLACARVAVAAGAGARELHQPDATDTDDALDLVRMDDDGGWQMPRPPA